MTPQRTVRVGTRGSGLALRQTDEVVQQLQALSPGVRFQVVPIKTQGDVSAQTPLATLGLGVFVREIESALLRGDIDMAVHSLKDLPTQQPQGLVLGAIGRRQDPRDVLVNRWGVEVAHLPQGARIGTSSPRRAAQLKALRPDVETLPIRGNVDTRLRKMDQGDYDGIVLAAAGLLRLGLEVRITQYLPPELFVPAPGQGALAVEVRQDNEEVLDLVSAINHGPTRVAVTAERAFLEALGGGCQVPVGAYAQVDGDTLVLHAFLSAPEGTPSFRTKARGRASNPHEVALDAYQRLIEKGAGVLLKAEA